MAKNSMQGYLNSHADGCSYHPICLTCPFSICVFEDAVQVSVEAKLMSQGGVQEVRRKYQQGATLKQLSHAFHLPYDTLTHRVLS